MLLNMRVFNQVVAEAKEKSAGNAAMIRAIDRAVFEILHAVYWAFDGQTLRIQSTTSKKLYVIEATGHTCDATTNGFKFCKHTVGHRLLLRYTQRLGVAAAEVETKPVVNWSAERGHEVVEHKRITVSDARGVKRIDGQIQRKRAEVVA